MTGLDQNGSLMELMRRLWAEREHSRRLRRIVGFQTAVLAIYTVVLIALLSAR